METSACKSSRFKEPVSDALEEEKRTNAVPTKQKQLQHGELEYTQNGLLTEPGKHHLSAEFVTHSTAKHEIRGTIILAWQIRIRG